MGSPNSGDCYHPACVTRPHPDDEHHVNTDGRLFTDEQTPQVDSVGADVDEVIANCPWRPECTWGYLSPDEAAAADALDSHLGERHGGQSPDDDADGDWERMQDEGRFPSWI